jgi:hypothetical protein
MSNIQKYYNHLCNTPSDIFEHLPTLYSYATLCETIFETGVRGVVSSWALAYGLLNNTSCKKFLLLNDQYPCDISQLLSDIKNTDLKVDYIWKNNLDIELIHNFDMLFIDTWHCYGQLKRELYKFAKHINKFIIIHDTTIDAITSDSVRSNSSIEESIKNTGWSAREITTGLWPAIEEFLENNRNEWTLLARYTNNNGLTILKRTKQQ